MNNNQNETKQTYVAPMAEVLAILDIRDFLSNSNETTLDEFV